MHTRHHPTFLIMTVLFAVAILLLREVLFLPNNSTQLFFFDVGQGDSALIISPSRKKILIDGGPNLTTLGHLGKYLSFFDRKIDMLVLSHPNLDHLASFPEIVNRYEVGTLLLPAIDAGLPQYQQLLTLALQKNIQILPAIHGTTIDIGDGLSLDVLWPPGEWQRKDENNASIVLRAAFKNNTVLFTGDMEYGAEQELLALGYDLQSTVLKVAHHGSKTSTSTGFLLAVRPATAVISVGKDNRFGHPHEEVTKRLTHFGIQTMLTSVLGTMEIGWK